MGPEEPGFGEGEKKKKSYPPYLAELLRMDLQVIQCSPHSHHHLAAVTGSHADVLSIGLFPFTHQGFGLLAYQPHRSGCDLERQKHTPLKQGHLSHLLPLRSPCTTQLSPNGKASPTPHLPAGNVFYYRGEQLFQLDGSLSFGELSRTTTVHPLSHC